MWVGISAAPWPCQPVPHHAPRPPPSLGHCTPLSLCLPKALESENYSLTQRAEAARADHRRAEEEKGEGADERRRMAGEIAQLKRQIDALNSVFIV